LESSLKRQLTVVVVALSAMLILAGCAVQTAAAGDTQISREDLPQIEASVQQVSELRNGVTEDEYLAAFARFEACMDDAGYPLVGVERSDHLMDYSMLAEAYDSGDSDRCYHSEFQQVDERWQFLNRDDSVTNRVYQACLTAAGVAPKVTTGDVWAQVLEAGLDPEKCAQEGGDGPAGRSIYYLSIIG